MTPKVRPKARKLPPLEHMGFLEARAIRSEVPHPEAKEKPSQAFTGILLTSPSLCLPAQVQDTRVNEPLKILVPSC